MWYVKFGGGLATALEQVEIIFLNLQKSEFCIIMNTPVYPYIARTSQPRESVSITDDINMMVSKMWSHVQRLVQAKRRIVSCLFCLCIPFNLLPLFAISILSQQVWRF